MRTISEIANELIREGEVLLLYEKIQSLPNCMNCAKICTCEYAPEWGRTVRYNCPLWDYDTKEEK